MKVFACQTTFERALVFEGTLEMFACAAEDVGATRVAAKIRKAAKALKTAEEAEKKAILDPIRDTVLSTAKRVGKARFAQIAAGHIAHATMIPKYLADAVSWLRAK